MVKVTIAEPSELAEEWGSHSHLRLTQLAVHGATRPSADVGGHPVLVHLWKHI